MSTPRRSTCQICGGRIQWVPRRFAWVHLSRGPVPAPEHGPVPA